MISIITSSSPSLSLNSTIYMYVVTCNQLLEHHRTQLSICLKQFLWFEFISPVTEPSKPWTMLVYIGVLPWSSDLVWFLLFFLSLAPLSHLDQVPIFQSTFTPDFHPPSVRTDNGGKRYTGCFLTVPPLKVSDYIHSNFQSIKFVVSEFPKDLVLW